MVQTEMQFESLFRQGERVRVIKASSPYTGCRGAIVEASGPAEDGQLPLGYHVAIDGENGLTRPFLAGDLAPVRAAKVRDRTVAARRANG